MVVHYFQDVELTLVSAGASCTASSWYNAYYMCGYAVNGVLENGASRKLIVCLCLQPIAELEIYMYTRFVFHAIVRDIIKLRQATMIETSEDTAHRDRHIRTFMRK